ncbi:MAG: FlgD immunoglobulin-like domain containing protein, partial [candidate division WOR-3 bacterium]
YLDQFGYDDDSAVGASHWSIGGNSGWGLRIRPLYYPALVRASQFSLRLPDSLGSYGYRLRIVDGNGPLGTPGTTLYQSPVLTASSGWNTDSLADRQIILRSGDCYLFYLQVGDWPSCAELNYDLSRDTLASFWQLRDGSYSQDNDTSRGDWMIRCLLDYNPPSSLAYDAHAVYVSAPEDELSLRPFGVSYVPSVRIENLGDSTLTDLPVICSIPGTGFSSRRTIDTLDSGAGLLVDFDPWAPLTSGTYEIRVWVDHALDQDRGNDTVSKSVQVLHPRYTGGPEILDRYAWIDSDTTGGPTYEWIDSTGAYILISADADLYISQALPFYFVYRDTFYDRIWVGNNGWLSFDPATSVASENDTIPNPAAPNNALYPFWDHLRAGAGPLSRVWYRTLGYAPGRKFVVTWDNMRFADVPGDTDLISFQVILDEESHNITFQYRDVTGSSSNHSFGRSATVGIENRDGTIGLQYLCGDSLGRGFWPANKLTSGRAITFFQVRRDMACREILEPHRYGLPGPVTPRVRVKNYGNIMDAFYVHVRFDSLLGGTDWHDSVLVNFLPMQTETTLTFGTWDARFGNWRMVCSTALAGDANPANDAIRQDVSIQSWLERASIPQGDYRKRVKYGAITYLDPYVYVLKGSNTNEFWRYDPRADSWDTLPSLPAGEGNRKAKDGCCLTADPSTRLIFATKGGNRLEFYAYNPATQTWMVRESIPWGTNGRGARNGTCMDYGFDKIFFLKGASTNEFYIYSVSGDRWVTGRGPIVEGSKISVRRGTSLAVFDTLVYCPNPHNRYGFLCYNIWDSTWRTRPTVPGGYRNRKVRAGSGSAIVGNTLYLTKGGNTNELWAYDLLGDTAWTPKADIPLGTYGKRIKTGGCMAKSDNYLFVLKGGNTTEFWIYAPAVDTVRMPDRQRLPDAQQLAMSFACRAATDPVTGPVTLQLALPKSLAARIKVFDITGGFVATIAQGVLPAGRHEFTWKRCDDYARPVANGIYILRFESDEFRSSQKLVLE